jgi:DNA repair exonuclease SbcCD ATPase subunit
VTEQQSNPGHVVAEAKIPFVADLDGFRESMREMDRMADDFAAGFKKKLGDAMGEAIRDAGEQIRALEDRLGVVRAASEQTAAPERVGSGQAQLDNSDIKLTEIEASVSRLEDLATEIRDALVEEDE